jgi:hypothetical protein
MHSRDRDWNGDLVSFRAAAGAGPLGARARSRGHARSASFPVHQTRRRSRFSDGSSIVGPSKQRFRKAARISASRRNGNGPISPSRGRPQRCSGCFRSLRFGRPIPQSPTAFARDWPRGITNANLPSATPWPPFEGSSGARRIYQCPGMTRMAWKFQPPSGKDSRKRSATRHKIHKVELRVTLPMRYQVLDAACHGGSM